MMTLKMLSSVLGATMAASLFATLRITEICPRPDALDPNGKEAGWIELTNTGDQSVNLKDFALIRWNRGKEDKKKNRRILCDRELGPGERTLVYTSEAYPNYWDGEYVAVYENDVMVFPSKVNPKKFPNVALYRKDQTTLLQTLIVPVDLEDDKSFGPGDAYNRIQVVDADSEYTYQVGEGEQQTGAGRLTVSTTQLPSDVAGRVEFSSTQQDELVATLTDYGAAKDDKNVLQANAYDFSAMDAGNKGVRVTPTAYPESMYAISFWFRSNPSEVKVNTNTTGNGMPLFESRPSGDGNRSGMMLFINDDGQLTLQPRNASGTSTTLATTKTYTDDLWHHVVIISGQKLGDKVALYVDGIAEIQGELANDCELQSTIPYCFGHAYNSTSWHTYKGQIADIRLFNREVSATDVAQLREENVASRNVTGTFIETKVSVLDGTVAGYAFENDIKANEMYVATREGCRSLCENGETLAFWIKPSAFTTSFGQEAITLMDSRNGSQDENGYLLLIGTNADTKQRKIYIQRGGKTKVNYEFANQEQLIVNEWTHVTFSIDATTKTATLYINGVKVDAQMMNDYTPATVTHRLGGSYDPYWCGFRGEMSEINIYSGVLPAREVAKLYNASTLATTKVTEAGTDESADVYEAVDTLPSAVMGEMTVILPEYAEGATLTFSAPETAGQLALTLNGKAIELDAPITLDGATAGALTWTLTADEGAHRMSVLITAELADKIAGETRAIMPNMTPGEANDYTNAIAYGPNIGPSNATKDGGLGYTLSSPMAKVGEPYAITLEVYPIAEDAQNAITKVELIYRSNFGEVKYVDASGSNGKYTGTIPAEDIPANGQLIQFGARITDGAGRQWISPSRNNPDDCPLWYGTIVEPTEEQKSQHEKLQTFHLFVEEEFLEKKYQQKANAEYVGLIDIDYDVAKKTYGKKLGARVGIYDGQTDTYYDNVRIDLRGNTSADFSKKSHGLRFSKCQPLTCVNPLDGSELEEIRKTSFTAEYADPTFIRQSLSFHVWRNAGNKMPFHYPVRLNLNGEFYQLAFHSNRFTDELIEDYYGLDPMGYGYKNVGTISPKVGTTAGSVEKKTPDDGDETSDLAYKPLKDWAETFKQSKDCPENDPTLTNVVYDSFDIPAWINYLATARITQECDDVWANICLYWDKNGNDVWMPLAYDHNLSFGAWYFGDDRNKGRIGLRADDDTFKSHPFYGGWKVRAYNLAGTALNEGNYAVEALWQNEDFRQMYLRRLRTLMDEHLKAPGTEQEDTPFWDYVELFKEVTAADAELDRAKWGYPDLKQSGKGEEIYVWDHENWDDPEIDGWDNSLAYDDMWDNYVVPRRKHLYETHSITNPAKAIGYASDKNAGIPNAHPETFAPILMEKVEGGMKLTNPNRDSIDLSGWTVEGLMDVSTLPEDSEDVFTLPPGTVLLGGKSLVLAYDRKEYVKNNDPCFVIGLAVYGDDKTWIPKPNKETTSIVLKKADGDVAVDNVLPAEIATWLNEAIAAGKVTAEALARVTAAADYELAYLLDEAPIADMAAATELDIAAFAIDDDGKVTLTATLTVNGKEKTGSIKGQIKLYAKGSLSESTWTEVDQEKELGQYGEASLKPYSPEPSWVPRFFKAKIER